MSTVRPGMPGSTRACPHCKATVLDSANICPVCRHHLRFDQKMSGSTHPSFSALKVEGMLRHPPAGDPWEYSMLLTIRNDKGEEIARQLIGVGALLPDEKRTFTVSVDVFTPAAAKLPRRQSNWKVTRRLRLGLKAFAVAALASGCGAPARLPVSAGIGPDPELPAPRTSLIPVVNVVTAKGWPEDARPIAIDGTTVTAFASGLNHPRWLYVLPNNDVLVAETNGPPRPEAAKGIKGWFFKYFQKKAGGAVPSANRISLLRDADGDGIAESRWIFLAGLNSPFGMDLAGNTLYVANTDAVVRFPYTRNQTAISARGTKVVDLPAGPINHHWTKNVIVSMDGSKLYVAVGSNSNAAERGFDREVDRASIWEVDARTGSHRVFASGLRNPVGMAWEPGSGKLWTAVNERDELGSDLVPDYMTAVRDGGFYGWPYSYFGQNLDPRVKPQRPDLVARAIVPDYALGAHTASLGLTWSGSTTLPTRLTNGMFVGQHGSWNREPRSGYKVIFVPFANGLPSGRPIDVLTGFVRENGDAMGRPTGVAVDRKGALLVADDVGNVVWRVTGSAPRQ